MCPYQVNLGTDCLTFEVLSSMDYRMHVNDHGFLCQGYSV